MKRLATLLGTALLLSSALCASALEEALRAKTGAELAEFMHRQMTGATPAGELLAGLNTSQILRLKEYHTGIPVKEVFGTIVETRYLKQLPDEFWKKSFSYEVREVCAYRDERGELFRYNICIYDETQYRCLRDLLAGRSRKGR